jgi:hypothetical protein
MTTDRQEPAMTDTTTTEAPPATLLTLAADRLEALASRSTPGPWVFRRSPDGDDYDELEILAGEAAATGGRSGPSEEWIVDGREIADMWESATVPGEQAERLAAAHEWMATLHPGVAAPLAGWLRHEAERMEGAGGLHPVLAAVAIRQPGRRDALEFARLVLAARSAAPDGEAPVGGSADSDAADRH